METEVHTPPAAGWLPFSYSSRRFGGGWESLLRSLHLETQVTFEGVAKGKGIEYKAIYEQKKHSSSLLLWQEILGVASGETG